MASDPSGRFSKLTVCTSRRYFWPLVLGLIACLAIVHLAVLRSDYPLAPSILGSGGDPEQPPSDEQKSKHGGDNKDAANESTDGGPPPLVLPEDPLIHGVHVSKMKHPDWKLEPFPDSPMLSPPDNQGRRNPWLATVICAAADVDRRMMIRSSWMRTFKDVPFDGRFVVSNPGAIWTEAVRFENQTYGDMIVLDHLHEDDLTANTVKTLELLRWLVDHDQKYEFVSKVDTDLWLNARGFWDDYITPRLSNATGQPKATVSETIIGQLYYSPPHKITFPHGSMYTYTWDLVELLPKLQDEHHVVAGEDLAVAMLLGKADRKVNVVNMLGEEKFDYDPKDAREDGSPWSRGAKHANSSSHALYGSRPMAIHQLKDKDLFMQVASLFTKDGIVDMPKDSKHKSEDDSKDGAHRTQLEAIPKEFWYHDQDKWVCNSLWITGKDKSGFQ